MTFPAQTASLDGGTSATLREDQGHVVVYLVCGVLTQFLEQTVEGVIETSKA